MEWAHHRELVGRARETLRVEMEANKRQLDANLRKLDENLVRERADLAVARQLQAGAKGLDGQFHSSFSWSGMASSAWQTAHETGALGYMPYAEVQGYDDVYVQQGYVNNAALDVFSHQTRAAAPVLEQSSLDQLAPEERVFLLRDTSALILELGTLRQMLAALDRQYADALAHPERH